MTAWVNSDLSDTIHEFLWLQLKHWGLNGFGLWGYWTVVYPSLL